MRTLLGNSYRDAFSALRMLRRRQPYGGKVAAIALVFLQSHMETPSFKEPVASRGVSDHSDRRTKRILGDGALCARFDVCLDSAGLRYREGQGSCARDGTPGTKRNIRLVRNLWPVFRNVKFRAVLGNMALSTDLLFTPLGIAQRRFAVRSDMRPSRTMTRLALYVA